MNAKFSNSFCKRILFLLVATSLFSCALQAQRPKKPVILKLVSGAEKITIDACDGKETLANAKEVFTSAISDQFKNWELDTPGIATKKTAVQIYEPIQNATYAQIFGSLGNNLEKLCLTQSQIKNYCKKNLNSLIKDRGKTIFLFNVDDQLFIAEVYVEFGELVLAADGIRSGRVLRLDYPGGIVVVVPKLND